LSAPVPITETAPEGLLLALVPARLLSSSNVLARAQINLPGGAQMELIGTFAGRFVWQFKSLLDWAIRNWFFTLLALLALIYWAGRQRRFNRHHL
jgi:hypothetical protein